jgi:acetyltransferase-like isoleucine patch superfamily enzyme
MNYVLRDMHSGNPVLADIGRYTYGHESIKLAFTNEAKLKIGKFCSIAWGLTIYLGGMHNTRWISTFPFGRAHQNIFNNYPDVCKVENLKSYKSSNGDVVIGNDVYIGSNVLILSGVKIGDGAVISTNSVIYENVKPYTVVGGNPSKVWFYRFSEEVIKDLLEMKWWDWQDSKINEIVPFLCSSDTKSLIEYYKKNIKLNGETN